MESQGKHTVSVTNFGERPDFLFILPDVPCFFSPVLPLCLFLFSLLFCFASDQINVLVCLY